MKTQPCLACGGEGVLDPLAEIMDTQQAAKRWGTTADYVKRLCQQGKVKAKRFGGTWILDVNQPNPLVRKGRGE